MNDNQKAKAMPKHFFRLPLTFLNLSHMPI
jgi:hypothetical protein